MARDVISTNRVPSFLFLAWNYEKNVRSIDMMLLTHPN